MSRAKRGRAPRPASENEMSRRIRHVIGLLPMSRAEVRAQVVIHESDEELFPGTFSGMREAGEVMKDRTPGWYRLNTRRR